MSTPSNGSRNGSVTATGTTMDSYYGRPIIKEPVWTREIPWYFFTGGIAGASSVLHGLARLTGNTRLAKTSLYVGAAADAVSPLLLIKDLGRPERFLNMFRVFKVTSPLSVGSWILLVSGGASNTAAVLELTGRLRPVKWAAELVSFASFDADERERLGRLFVTLVERGVAKRPSNATLVERLERALARRPRLAIDRADVPRVGEWVELFRGRVVASAPPLVSELTSDIERRLTG